jgi:hypothetical protein
MSTQFRDRGSLPLAALAPRLRTLAIGSKQLSNFAFLRCLPSPSAY